MTPLLALGIKVGMGAITGHKLALRMMKPKQAQRGLGQLPPVGVGANLANGIHYISNAKIYLLRNDLVNAGNSVRAAFRVAGIRAPAFANTVPVVRMMINKYLQKYAQMGPAASQLAQQMVA